MPLLEKVGLFIVVLLFCTITAVHAQPPTETCAGANLGAADTLPLMASLAPSGNDFSMTGSGCTEQGADAVVCFTPTNSCTVTFACENDAGIQSANVFLGSCTTSPAMCTATASGPDGTITGLVLTAGQEVCFVCEYSAPSFVDFIIQETSGSCGALPAELLSFSVESSPSDPEDEMSPDSF